MKAKKDNDSKNQTRVLLEDIRQQVTIVAEGHSTIIRKLDEHTRILDEHTRILGEHTRILGEHGDRLNNHDTHLDRIENVLTDIHVRVINIEKDHGARLTRLEEKVFM